MSVQTTADNILDGIDRDLDRIIGELMPIIKRSEDVWGAKDYSREYYQELFDVFRLLSDARFKLNR